MYWLFKTSHQRPTSSCASFLINTPCGLASYQRTPLQVLYLLFFLLGSLFPWAFHVDVSLSFFRMQLTCLSSKRTSRTTVLLTWYLSQSMDAMHPVISLLFKLSFALIRMKSPGRQGCCLFPSLPCLQHLTLVLTSGRDSINI